MHGTKIFGCSTSSTPFSQLKLILDRKRYMENEADRLERILLLRCNKNFSASPNFHPHLLNSLQAISIMSIGYIHSLYLSVQSFLYTCILHLVSAV